MNRYLILASMLLAACQSTTVSSDDLLDTWNDLNDSLGANSNDPASQPDAVAEFPAPAWFFAPESSAGYAIASSTIAAPGGATFTMPALLRYKATDTNGAGSYTVSVEEVTFEITHNLSDDSWAISLDGPMGAYATNLPKTNSASWSQSANSSSALMGHPTITLSYYTGTSSLNRTTDGGTTKLQAARYFPWSNGFYEEENYVSIIGFDTDPTTISAMTGTASFGGYMAMKWEFDPDSGSDQVYADFQKEQMTLNVDFDRDQLSGVVWITPPTFKSGFTADNHVFVDIGPVPIEGNGFIASLKEDDWSRLGLDDADIRIVGAFYEEDGATLAGLIYGDVSSRDNSAAGGNGTDGSLNGAVYGSFLTEKLP